MTDGHAFVLPTDYNRLIAQHPVTVRDSDDAWVLIDLYLRMHEARLGAMGLVPIDTSSSRLVHFVAYPVTG